MNVDDRTIIRQLCTAFLNEKHDSKVNYQLSLSFDKMNQEFQKNIMLRKNANVIIEVTTALTAVHREQWLQQPQLLGHQLFIILRDCLTEFLFDDQQFELVTKVSTLLHDICHIGLVNDEMVRLMLHKPLVDKMVFFIAEIEQNNGTTRDIASMNRLFRISGRIQTMRVDLYQNSLLEDLFVNVSKCIGSNVLMAQLSCAPKVMTNMELMETFLFDTCIEFMYWQPYEESLLRRQRLKQICEAYLPTVVRLMSSLSCSELVIRVACLLSIDIMAQESNGEDTIPQQDFFELVKHCVTMLEYEKAESKQRMLLECICHLTNDFDLLACMKETASLKRVLLKLSETDDCEISLNAYRILALIMNEADVKALENAKKIVQIYYLYFISMSEDPVQRTAFQSLLYSLKSLIQHDQVKVEVLQQDVIPLLVRCVTEKQSFHSVKTQQYAIEILLALTFNKEASSILGKDSDLITCLETLKKSKDEKIERAAIHLAWQLEQKRSIPSARDTHDVSKSKFDIMISYSHCEKKHCFQICDFLEKVGFHVWIDRDRMHGDATAAMADAIENSEFVIICMSESYKLSPYCQAEANYAFQRRCKLVPLVMKPKYKPDGWLGFVTSGKIYVDFTKYEFNMACAMLRKEIEDKREAVTSKATVVAITHEAILPTSSPMKLYRRQRPVHLPCSIMSWSEDHVSSFFQIYNLTSLVTVFETFNGRLLHQAYLMCEQSRESMFQAMRKEVDANSNSAILTLGTYLRFLDELKKYIPTETEKSLQTPASAVCSVM